MRDLFAFEPALAALHFAFAAPADIRDYERFFRVQPQFSKPTTMAVLDRALFEQRMPLANDLALHAAREQCRKLLDARRTRPGLSSKVRSEENTSELQSLMRISYADFCLKKKQRQRNTQQPN